MENETRALYFSRTEIAVSFFWFCRRDVDGNVLWLHRREKQQQQRERSKGALYYRYGMASFANSCGLLAPSIIEKKTFRPPSSKVPKMTVARLLPLQHGKAKGPRGEGVHEGRGSYPQGHVPALRREPQGEDADAATCFPCSSPIPLVNIALRVPCESFARVGQ